MFEKGHSFDEIDNTGMNDFMDVVGYWAENSRADEKEASQRKQRDNLRAKARK